MPWRRRMVAAGLALAMVPGTWLRSPELPASQDQTLRLDPLASPGQRAGPFRIAGVWNLTSRNSRFGSYSALVAPASGRLLAFSDRGDFLEFAVPDGKAQAAVFGTVAGGRARYKQHRDVEAATRDPATGQIHLALEGRNAAARYAPDLAPQSFRQVPEMRRWSLNAGPEAMVRLRDGRFVVLCECDTGWLAEGQSPGLLFAGDPAEQTIARRFTFAGAAGHHPTDMAELPDGRVLVLVRRLTWPLPPRFEARLLLADPAGLSAAKLWRAVELARLGPPLPVDNFEGLAITPGSDGKVLAWLISDDNQALSQRTLLWKLEFLIEDLPRTQKAPGFPDAPR